MKVTVYGNRQEQIIQGVEPWETREIELALDRLTVEQRKVLTTSPRLTLIAGTVEETTAALQALIDEEAARVARDQERQREKDAKMRAQCATAQVEESKTSKEGVEYPFYSAPYIGTCCLASSEVNALVEATQARLTAEANQRNRAAEAAVAPAIAAAKAAREAKEAEAEAAKAAARAAKYAKRLETGIVEIDMSRGDRGEWGEPWIAQVTSGNGRRPQYDFSAGTYDTAREVLTIPCKPGDVIAYGQKNYRKGKRTIHNIRKMQEDGSLVSA